MPDQRKPGESPSVSVNVDALLRDLRFATEHPGGKAKRQNRFWRAFSDGWKRLFIVRLWIACTNHIIRAVETSDPLALGGLNGALEEDRRAREKLQRLIKTNQRLKLRRLIANWAIFFVIIQLACSNVFFWLYLRENHYTVQPQVMIAWLSACVIEVIGILMVIARSLFPKRDKGDSGSS